MATGKHLRKLGDPKDNYQFQQVVASADNRFVAISVSKGDIEFWDAVAGRVLRTLKTGRVPHLALSPNGRILVVLDIGTGRAGEKKNLRLFDTTTGEERHQLSGFQSDVGVPTFTNDGKTLVAADEKFIRFWDVETGKQGRELKLAAPVGAIVLSPDNRLFATVGVEKIDFNNAKGLSGSGSLNTDQIILQDLQTGKEVHRLAKHHNGVMPSAYPLAFSPDGKSFVSSDFKSIRWWDVATGKETPERTLRVPFVHVAAFSLDGKAFAAAGAVIQIWDVETGKPKGAQHGHQSGIYCTAVSPDGKILATGGTDPLRLWHAATGEEIRQFPTQEGGHWFIRFVSNGNRLVAGSGTGDTNSFVHIWEIATGKGRSPALRR